MYYTLAFRSASRNSSSARAYFIERIGFSFQFCLVRRRAHVRIRKPRIGELCRIVQSCVFWCANETHARRSVGIREARVGAAAEYRDRSEKSSVLACTYLLSFVSLSVSVWVLCVCASAPLRTPCTQHKRIHLNSLAAPHKHEARARRRTRTAQEGVGAHTAHHHGAHTSAIIIITFVTAGPNKWNIISYHIRQNIIINACVNSEQ